MRIYRHVNMEYGYTLEEFSRVTLAQVWWLRVGDAGSSTRGGRPMSYAALCELTRKIRAEHGLQDS